jgi:5-methylcytosine-specific restriction endonuclease McrA
MGSQTELKRKLLIKAFGRQKGKCHICGVQMSLSKDPNDPMRATADHLLPKSLGGQISGNIAAAHYGCNHRRGNKRLHEMELRT